MPARARSAPECGGRRYSTEDAKESTTPDLAEGTRAIFEGMDRVRRVAALRLIGGAPSVSLTREVLVAVATAASVACEGI